MKASIAYPCVLTFASLLFMLSRTWMSLLTQLEDVGASLENSISFKHSSSSTNTPTDDCDPYFQPGIIDDELQWKPFAQNCQPVNYMKEIRSGEISSSTRQLFQNKTIVTLGDSIDRFALHTLCPSLGLKSETIRITDERSPSLPEHFWTDDLASKNHPMSHTISRPTLCHVDSLNFTMLNVFHWGLSTAEELKGRGAQSLGVMLPNHNSLL